jgi:tetratricopeptide (TPR) repeat protein
MTDERMHCPPAETLGALADGRLERRRIPEVLAHLEHCDTCTTALELANEEVHAAAAIERAHTWRPWALYAAAALAAVTIASLLALRPWRTAVDKLVAASPRTARVAEPRLAGGFRWAAYRGPLRTDAAQRDPAQLRLAGVAADAVERGAGDSSPAAQHAAGVALVLIDDPLAAIPHLRAAAEGSPNDAGAWSDLAAAEYAAALRLGRPSLYPDALGHAERALRIDGRLAEAIFNRALTLERIGLTGEARTAWARYLEVDPSSDWAKEARQHLAHLPLTTGESVFGVEQPRLEEAAAAGGDPRAVAAIVDRHRERARAFGEVEYLGRWAEALKANQPDEAMRWLAVARGIGEALVTLSGESLLRDAVAVVDARRSALAVDARGSALAEAHLAYRRGRILYAQHKPTEAEPELRRAAAAFAAAGDPLALVARGYAANTRLDQHDVAGARAELEALARELRGHPRYVAASGNVQWELAVARSTEGDWTGAVASLAEAAAAFTRLGESSNLASIENLRAYALDVLGRPDDAWAARIRCLTAESRERRGERLGADLITATDSLVRAGKHDAALAFLAIEERTQRAAHSEAMLVYALVRETQLAAAMNDGPAARRSAGEALAVASRLSDPKLRAQETAVAQLAGGIAALSDDPRQAHALLTKALEGLRATPLRSRVADAALFRARAALRLGDGDGAGRDLDAGIVALEGLSIPVGGASAPGVFDTGAALFEEAVRQRLDRGDVAGALSYAERSRGRGAGTTPLQQRLAGSGTAVLESFVLRSFVSGEEIVVFALDGRELIAARRPLPSVEAKLYDALIRPAEPLLARARRLIIVPDPRLAGVPYAALSDGTRLLLERMPVAIAPSASKLERVPRLAPRSVAAMALPLLGPSPDSSGASAPAALPESEQEAAEVAQLYGSGAVVPATLASLRERHVDVLHIAGHTTRDGSDDAALTFEGNERVAWSAIAALPLHAGIVTLSACETLRDPAHPGARALSLGAGFLAAGAHDVIGTLVPISDRDARTLFLDIHRQLASGVEPAEALRRAQLDDFKAGGSAWRALAVATNRID